MVKYIQHSAFLIFVLGGMLTGIVAEQLNVLRQDEYACLADFKQENKDNSESKKSGEDDKIREEHFSVHELAAVFDSGHLKSPSRDSDLRPSLHYLTILTPPPERV